MLVAVCFLFLLVSCSSCCCCDVVAKFPYAIGHGCPGLVLQYWGQREKAKGVSVQTWSFLGATRVLRASAWRDECGGRGDDRVGMHGKGARVGAGKGERSADEGWCKWVGSCSCP